MVGDKHLGVAFKPRVDHYNLVVDTALDSPRRALRCTHRRCPDAGPR